jgi:hypothetical protein
VAFCKQDLGLGVWGTGAMKEVRRGRGQDFLYLGGDKEVRSADQLELSERNDPRLMLLMRRKGCQGGKRVPEPGQASRAGLLALATQVPFGWTCGLGWMAWEGCGKKTGQLAVDSLPWQCAEFRRQWTAVGEYRGAALLA